MSQQIVQMGGAAPGLSGDRVTMYVQNPSGAALAKGTVVRITRSGPTTGVDEANSMLQATTGAANITAVGGIHAVLLEDSTADTSALVHVCLRGRVDTLLVNAGSVVNGDTLLILATGANSVVGGGDYQGYLCSAADAPASPDAVSGEVVSPQPHKIMGYYADAVANNLTPAGTSGLRTIDFDGIAGFGTAVGDIDVTPTP